MTSHSEGHEGQSLGLSAQQLVAVRVYGEFLESVAMSDDSVLARSTGSPLALMLTASSAVLTAALPNCHHAPPGESIGPKWSSASPPRLVLRCTHTTVDGGPHCWDSNGGPTSC